MRAQWLAALTLILAVPASGETPPPGLNPGNPAVVQEVLSGETLRLVGGSELRLAAILAPHATPPRAGQTGRPDPELERLRTAARLTLAKMTEGRTVTVHAVGPSPDRYRRQVAHLAGPTGEWVQATLVSQGLARVQTTTDSSAGAETLLRLEAAAREARLGLWRHEAFRIRSPGELGRWIETFQIVEGMAVALPGRSAGLAVDGGGARLMVNLTARARSELRAAGMNAETLSGQPLRVRGWLRWQNGPVIDVTHAAPIERLTRKD